MWEWLGKVFEEVTFEWNGDIRFVCVYIYIWEKIVGDRRNNICKGIEVRISLVCL